MAFTAKDVQSLRQKTNCGMMDCKKALTEAEGDMDKAIEILREKGLAAAVKKAGRIAAEGIVSAVVEGQVGIVLEVNAETDFVAKNESFLDFVKSCEKAIIEQNPGDVESLLSLKANDTQTIDDILKDKILTIGENIKIRRFTRAEGTIVTYVHAGGKIGVMVEFETDLASKEEFQVYGRDVAMQIAALNPQFLSKGEVDTTTLEKEKEILLAQALGEGKPQNIAEKMVEGRMAKYYKENCLVEQEFVKDGDLTIGKLTEKIAKELGGSIKILRFTRYEKGEGIEKKEEDYAAEVAKMAGN